MRFLQLDTADSRGSVALCQDSQVLAVESHISDDDYSSWLLPAVGRILAAASLTLEEVDGYAVCSGPGSFTGLRVGLTTVKAWSEIYTKPIAALSRLEAFTLSEPPSAEPFLTSCIDARRSQCFAALYTRAGHSFKLVGDESVTSVPEFMARVKESTTGKAVRWRTPDPAMFASAPDWPAFQSSGHRLETVNPPFAGVLARLAFQKFRTGDTRDALSLDANYVRRSDAELFWKGNKSAYRP